MGDPLKTRYSSTYVITPNSVALGQTKLASARVPKNLGDTGPTPPWNGGVGDA